MVFDVWANSDPNMIAGVLNSVAMIVHSVPFKTLLAISALIGLLGSVLMSIQGRMSTVVNFILGLAVFMFIYSPSATVMVKPVSSPNPLRAAKTVFNVPIMIAFPMSLFTTMGKWMGSQFENTIYASLASSARLPNSSKIYGASSGPGLTLMEMDRLKDMTPAAATLARAKTLINQCVFPRAVIGDHLRGGKMTLYVAPSDLTDFTSTPAYLDCQKAVNSTTMKLTPSTCLPYIPVRDLQYYSTNRLFVTDPVGGTQTSCDRLFTQVKSDLSAWSTAFSTKNSSWAGANPDKIRREIINVLMNNKVPGWAPAASTMDSYGWPSLAKLLSDSLLTYKGADISNDQLKAVFGKVSNAETGRTIARTMVEYLPIISDVCMGIVAAFFPLAVIVMVMTSSNIGRATQFLSVLLSFAFWPPMIAIINALVNYYTFHLSEMMHSVAKVAYLPPQSAMGLITVASQAEAPIAALGYLSAAVPLIALGLVKGGEVAFTHAFQGLTSGSRQTAEQVSLDRFSADNNSFHNHSAPSYGLEGFREYERSHPGGFTATANDMVEASGVQIAEHVGHAKGVVNAGAHALPGRPALQSVQGVSENITTNQTATEAGVAAARKKESGTGEIAPTAFNVGYQGTRLADPQTQAKWHSLEDALHEGGKLQGPLEEATLDQIAGALDKMSEVEWHKAIGGADGYLATANQHHLNGHQLARFLEFMQQSNRYGQGIKARELMHRLGYSDPASFFADLANGTFAKQITSSKAFDSFVDLMGGDMKKALTALALSMGLDQSQAAHAAQILMDAAKQSGDPVGYFHRLARYQGLAQALAVASQAKHAGDIARLTGSLDDKGNVQGDKFDHTVSAMGMQKTTEVARNMASGEAILRHYTDASGHFNDDAFRQDVHALGNEQLFKLLKMASTGDALGENAGIVGRIAGREMAGRLLGAFQAYKKEGLDNRQAMNAALLANIAKGGGDIRGLIDSVKAVGGGRLDKDAVSRYMAMAGIKHGSEQAAEFAKAIYLGGLNDEEKKALMSSDEQTREHALMKMRDGMMKLGIDKAQADAVMQQTATALKGLPTWVGKYINRVTSEDNPDNQGFQEDPTHDYSDFLEKFLHTLLGAASVFAIKTGSKYYDKYLDRKFSRNDEGGGNHGSRPSQVSHEAGTENTTSSAGTRTTHDHGEGNASDVEGGHQASKSSGSETINTEREPKSLDDNRAGHASRDEKETGAASAATTKPPADEPSVPPAEGVNAASKGGKRKTRPAGGNKTVKTGLLATGAGGAAAAGAATVGSSSAEATPSPSISGSAHTEDESDSTDDEESDEEQVPEEKVAFVAGQAAGTTFVSSVAIGNKLGIPKSKAGFIARTALSAGVGAGVLSESDSKKIIDAVEKITDWTSYDTGNTAANLGIGLASLHPIGFAVNTLAGLEQHTIEAVFQQMEKDGTIRKFFDEDTSLSTKLNLLRASVNKIIRG